MSFNFNPTGYRPQDDFQGGGGFKRGPEESTTYSPAAYQQLTSQMMYIVAGNRPEISAQDVVKDPFATDNAH